MSRVTVDADEVIELLNEIRREINEKIDDLGRFLARGMVTEPSKGTPRQEPETGIGVPTDGWTSYETKEEAGAYVDGWRFASDRDGKVYPEVEALVDRIYESGKVERGSFTYKLSKDGKFLQRRRGKK